MRAESARVLLPSTMGSRLPLMTMITVLLAFSGLAGCSSNTTSRAQRMQRGFVYYLDGAGGGKAWSNWSHGLKKGILAAGYDGAGEMFSWQTGLGAAVDQGASNEYKKKKAKELASQMAVYDEKYAAPMTLIGLSAGTAVAIFTLEELPADVFVENAVLLSGSLSARYDLTKALRRVRGKLYITTSTRDSVLQVLMPLEGTADRGSGTVETIGVQGPKLPASAGPETRRLYREKVVEIPWNQEFAKYGNRGKHTDSVKSGFVQHFIAPLIKTAPALTTAASSTPPGGTVMNPDYRRWEGFAAGSWVEFKGIETIDGADRPVRVRVTLCRKTGRSLLVERKFLPDEPRADSPAVPQILFVQANIDPADHPMTHPECFIADLPAESVTVDGNAYWCAGVSATVSGEFEAWGRNPVAAVYRNARIPGGIARLRIATQIDDKHVEFDGRAIAFKNAS